MGLYDYLRCELPLPHSHNKLEFQTKDTPEQYMMHHTINAAGRLIFHYYQMEETPKAERPYPNAPEDSFFSMCGSVRPKAGTERDVDLNFDGDINFYCDSDADYRATFRHGDCVEICQHVGGSWTRVWASTTGGVQ